MQAEGPPSHASCLHPYTDEATELRVGSPNACVQIGRVDAMLPTHIVRTDVGGRGAVDAWRMAYPGIEGRLLDPRGVGSELGTDPDIEIGSAPQRWIR